MTQVSKKKQGSAKSAGKKSPAKKAAPKKPSAAKPAAKKAPTKPVPAKKGAAPTKPAPKATTTKRPVAKKGSPAKPAAKKPAAPPRPPKPAANPSLDQARRAAERVVGAFIRALLLSRKRSYLEGITIEKNYYAPVLFEESRKTYTRYLDAEQKEKILKLETVSPTLVHVYTSGEGMGKNRYACTYESRTWMISAVDVMCGDCNGAGGCRWCEGKGCIDCQSTGRCVPCSGTGWTKWAK